MQRVACQTVSALATSRSAPLRHTLRPALLALGVLHVVLAAWMLLAPRSFFAQVGPFGTYNGHYVRDNATWEMALGALALLAAVRPAWRVPVLALAAVQGALHAVNHVWDVDAARPGSSAGVLDAVSLGLLAVVLVALLWGAVRAEGTG